ncbi:hypothetical protein [Mucilaginibacter sp. L3T2-6]|uniref:hypothetical protein n=1 Tax=Mucilaginibacter sp. L3T2-6 TaxID=3062491 RepID=UPI0026765437|nr:hypothetical protein [Mucilaginibacter sp. L3T2-6]MDO3642807.1 hypothetical protein [Mucilaginibacter sp. L3T2-6]MDV6215456.1 hypothetical protein [Mucilaginibacter sp. L3T2-6]
MNPYTLLQTFLALHLTGLVLMAGTIVVDSMIYRAFWRQYNTETERSVNLLTVSGKFGRITGIGAALLILTGIGMMAVTHGVFGEQLWFRVKFGLVIVLIVINLLARRRGLKLRKAIVLTESGSPAVITGARAFLERYFIAAFTIFFFIILLSVFKFN